MTRHGACVAWKGGRHEKVRLLRPARRDGRAHPSFDGLSVSEGDARMHGVWESGDPCAALSSGPRKGKSEVKGERQPALNLGAREMREADEPLHQALDVVEKLLLGQVANARKQVEAKVKGAVRMTPAERRQIRAIGNGLRFAGDVLNELLDGKLKP